MRPWMVTFVFALGVVAGCMAAGPPAPAEAPAPGIAAARGQAIGTPLVLDRADLRLGTTVQFARVPEANELYELHQLTGLAHVVLTLPAWPAGYAELAPLEQTPPEADVIVVLPGFPPTREAADAWNLIHVRLRLVMVVDGTPPSPAMVSDLNALRGLERVIVETPNPSPSGFERLQRPLSFRVIRN